jgi:hypothetical protein
MFEWLFKNIEWLFSDLATRILGYILRQVGWNRLKKLFKYLFEYNRWAFFLLGVFLTIAIPILLKDLRLQCLPESPKTVDQQQLFDKKTGHFGYKVDPNLTIDRISYPLGNQDCFVSLIPPEPEDLDSLPIVFDEEEHTEKIRTCKLYEPGWLKHADLLEVPGKIQVIIGGVHYNDLVTLHMFTDEEYPQRPLTRGVQGIVEVEVNIGAPGFLGYMELPYLMPPRFPEAPQKNMIGRNLGPIAILVVSAQKPGKLPHRSKAYPLIRSGFRTPDDCWVINGKPQLAYVADTLPPLIVFQSVRTCGAPPLQAVFASTINGSQVYQLTPDVAAQNTLIRVEPGPPAEVYFRSNFESGGDRVCYKTILDGSPINRPVRTDESDCERQ